MACLCVVSNNGFTVTQENLRFHAGKTKYLARYRGLQSSLSSPSYNSVPLPILGFYTCCKSQHGLFYNSKFRSLISGASGVPLLGLYNRSKSGHGFFCKNEIKSLVTGNSGKKHSNPRNGKNSDIIKKFLFRLRPRLRLWSMRLKTVSIRSLLNDIGMFLRKNTRRVTLSTLISVALGLCYLLLKLTASPSPKMVPYSDLILSLENGSVTKVLLEEGSRRIHYNTNSLNLNTQMLEDNLSQSNAPNENVANASNENVASMLNNDAVSTSEVTDQNVLRKSSRAQSSTSEWQYSTRKIDHDEKFLLSLLREKRVTYSSAPQSLVSSMRSILITVLTLWIPLTPLMWLLYRQLSSANSPAKKQRPSNQMVNFDDVEGVDTAKVELMEIVMCLQGAINYKKLGAKLPRGVLLVGPPGTGKTLLARAVAGEAGVPFFIVSASEFVELFVGRGAARIRDLFNVARKCAPSIIFIDELDAVGGKRGRSFNDERDQTLNQLLTEMDGFESDMRVVVIAATNRPEALDPALCRPGRFSRKVLVGEPDENGRRKILMVHLRGVPLEEDPCLISNLVASLTQGFVGADLANIVNEAALLAARRGGEIVTREDIMEAIERAKFGINDRNLSPGTIRKELRKLFPWMTSRAGRTDTKQGALQGPMGYQTLS